jgi:thimet oligopeptidase
MSTESVVARLATSTADDLARAADTAIAEARAGVDVIRGRTLSGLARLEAYDEVRAALSNAADLVSLLAVCHPDAALRDAADAAKQAISKVSTDISLDRDVYDALVELDVGAADEVTRHYVGRVLRDFRRAGVDRDEPTRSRVRDLVEELVTIGQDFDRNIRTDTRTAELDPAGLDGLPEDFVRAHPPGPDGRVRVTTDYPDVYPMLMYARDGAVREQLWRLFLGRGHPSNIDVLRRMLERRHELATLLGYAHWADYAAEDKMIGTADNIADFIDRISTAAGPRAERDYAALLERKRANEPDAEVVWPWDSAYLDDRIKAERYAFDTQAVRPYFEYGRVKTGLMELLERLFGVAFTARPDLPAWHPEVECFDVTGSDGLLGRIYLDMHPRPDKYNHAAMFPITTGKTGHRVPECALLCNLPRPGAEPALMQHTEVRTLFHEFGHLIHHIFAGDARWSGLSGIATEWDFVEAPSQLLEEWINDADVLARFATHHETGEPIPAATVARMRAAEEAGKGLQVRQQMCYATLSLELYRHDPAGIDPAEVERRARARHTPFPPVPGTWLHLNFGHLDGYSAIYYTYMWSLVIAKDLFTVFAADGLLATDTARRYRDRVLAPGGAAPAADLVSAFLGRPYGFEAYERWLNAPDPRVAVSG